jgi:hypothetical protein
MGIRWFLLQFKYGAGDQAAEAELSVERNLHVHAAALPKRETGKIGDLRAVELGAEVSDSRVVLKGLAVNDSVVLDGAFHLNNKRRQDQIKGAE